MTKSVLIVEDDSLLAEVYQRSMAAAGIKSVVASTKAEVLDSFVPRETSLVILDIVLSDSNGFEVLKVIRKQPGASLVPIIIVTGLNTDEVNINRELQVSLNIVGLYTKSQLPIMKLVEVAKLSMR